MRRKSKRDEEEDDEDDLEEGSSEMARLPQQSTGQGPVWMQAMAAVGFIAIGAIVVPTVWALIAEAPICFAICAPGACGDQRPANPCTSVHRLLLVGPLCAF